MTEAKDKEYLVEGLPLYIKKIDYEINPEEIIITLEVKGNKLLDLRFPTPRNQDAFLYLINAIRGKLHEASDWSEKNLPHR